MNGDTFSNIDGGHLKLLGKTELAEGDEILLAEHVVLVLGTHHHRSVLVGRSATLGALEANLVEPKVGHLYAVIRIGLKIFFNYIRAQRNKVHKSSALLNHLIFKNKPKNTGICHKTIRNGSFLIKF